MLNKKPKYVNLQKYIFTTTITTSHAKPGPTHLADFEV